MIRKTPLIAMLALVGLLGLTACGDDSDGDDAGASDTGSEDTADSGGAAADCDMQPGETVTVEIGDFVFEPTPVSVGACDSIVWSNVHSQAHTSTGQGDKTWSTGNVQPGEMSEPVLFDEAGSFAYICALHPFMKGTVEVT